MATQEQSKATEGGWSEKGSEGQELQVGAHGVAGNATAQQALLAPESGESKQEPAVNKDYNDSKKAAKVKEAAKAARKKTKQSTLRARAESILRIAERETSHLEFEYDNWWPTSESVSLAPGTKLPFKSLSSIRREHDLYQAYHDYVMRELRPSEARDMDEAFYRWRPSQPPINLSPFTVQASINRMRVFHSHLRHLRRALWIREDPLDPHWVAVGELFEEYSECLSAWGPLWPDRDAVWSKILKHHQHVPLGLSRNDGGPDEDDGGPDGYDGGSDGYDGGA